MSNTSSRTTKIAAVAVLAGLMLTVAIVAVTADGPPAPTPPITVRTDGRQNRLANDLDRCATLTMPDSGCEVAWAQNRRRFFRQDDPAPGGAVPDAHGTTP